MGIVLVRVATIFIDSLTFGIAYTLELRYTLLCLFRLGSKLMFARYHASVTFRSSMGSGGEFTFDERN